MTHWQETKLVEILHHLGEEVVKARSGRTSAEIAGHVGRIEYLIWEARTTLDLPEIPGLKPI